MTYQTGLCQYVKSLMTILHSFQKSLIQEILKITLNSDMEIIKNWAYQWKMQFYPDPKKQANEVIFSRKSNRCTCPPVTFNNNIIAACLHQKHLGVFLDSKLNFSIHIEQKISKCNKIIGLIRRLSVCLQRKALLTFYKSFVRLRRYFV